MVLGRRKTYAKKVVNKIVTAKREQAQQETQTQQNTSWEQLRGPKGVFWIVWGFFLGRLHCGDDHFLTTFVAYVLRRPKTIILPCWGFLDLLGDMSPRKGQKQNANKQQKKQQQKTHKKRIVKKT